MSLGLEGIEKLKGRGGNEDKEEEGITGLQRSMEGETEEDTS